jgi:hypothetical protein
MRWVLGLQWKNKLLPHLRNVLIQEYDMTMAGLCALRRCGAYLDLVERLQGLPKYERVIQEGLAKQRDPDIDRAMTHGLQLNLLDFCRANNIDQSRLIAVRRDSLTFYGPRPTTTEFEFVKWKHVGDWDVYHRLDQIELFMSLTGDVVYKGMGAEKYELHVAFLAAALRNYMALEISSSVRCLEYLARLRSDYLNFRLPVGFYREFNADSFYRTTIGYHRQTVCCEIPPSSPEVLDITYNYINVILPLLRTI